MTFQNGLGRGDDRKLMPWSSSVRLEKGLRKSRDSISFVHTCFTQGKAYGGMARPVCLREWRPQHWEENLWTVWVGGMPGGCDATEEPTFAQSADQGKKPREITTSVQRFKKKKWFIWRKLCAQCSGKDCVTWPGVWGDLLCCSHHNVGPSASQPAEQGIDRKQERSEYDLQQFWG